MSKKSEDFLKKKWCTDQKGELDDNYHIDNETYTTNKEVVEIMDDYLKTQNNDLADETQKAIEKLTLLKSSYPKMMTINVIDLLKRLKNKIYVR